MKKIALAVALLFTITVSRPADAQVPVVPIIIILAILGWAPIIYFYHVIGADKCNFQPSNNGYYDVAGNLAGGALTTKTEDCGPAEIDVAAALAGPERYALLVVQPNINPGWDFRATFPSGICSDSFDLQLSVAINGYLACINSGDFRTAQPIYAVANQSRPPVGTSIYNSAAGDLGNGLFGWSR